MLTPIFLSQADVIRTHVTLFKKACNVIHKKTLPLFKIFTQKLVMLFAQKNRRARDGIYEKAFNVIQKKTCDVIRVYIYRMK